MKRIYRWIVSMSLYHRRILSVGLVLLTALLGFFATKVELKTNFKDLLGENRSVMVAYDALQENYPDASAIFAVIEGPSAAEIVRTGNRLASVLEDDAEWVRDVRWREQMDFFRSNSFLLSETNDLVDLLDDLGDHPNLFRDAFAGFSLSNMVMGMNRSFEEYDDVSSVQEDEDDLIRGMVHTTAWLGAVSRGFAGEVNEFEIERALTDLLADPDDDDLLRFVDDEGHMISPDGTVGLLQIVGQGDANDAVYGTQLTLHIRELCQAVNEEFPSTKIGLTGFPVILADEAEAVQQGMGLGFVLAILGILAVFFLSFRRIVLPSLAAIPLLVGIVWSVGWVAVTIGEFSLFSMMAPIILLGLGIDYSIHLIAQFMESRAKGLDLEAALHEVFSKIGRGLFIGAMTTALTFFAIATAGFKGISDFGIVGGLSVLSAFAAMILILPLILVMVDSRRTRRGKSTVNVPLKRLGLLAEGLARWRWGVYVGMFIALIGGAFMLGRLELETDVMEIQPKGLESIRLQDLILEAFEFSIYTTFAMLDNLEGIHRAKAELDDLPTVKRVESLASFLPSEAVQQERRALIRRIEPALRAADPDRDPAIDPDILEREFDDYADQLFQMKTFAYMGGMTRLVGEIEAAEVHLVETREALRSADPSDLVAVNRIAYDKMQREYESMMRSLDRTTLAWEDVPRTYMDRYIGADGSYLLTIYPTHSPWEAGFGEAHQVEIETVLDAPTGTVPIWNEVLRRMIPGFLRASVVALGVLALLLLADLRSIRRTVLILIPLLASLFFTFSLIPAMGMKVNIVNLMAFPLILGIGIDDGVHLYHRYLVEQSTRRAFASTGKAILTTTLTTVMAMLTLGFSPHRGMVSFGWVASVGIGLCLILNVLILPGLIRTFDPPEAVAHNSSRRVS